MHHRMICAVATYMTLKSRSKIAHGRWPSNLSKTFPKCINCIILKLTSWFVQLSVTYLTSESRYKIGQGIFELVQDIPKMHYLYHFEVHRLIWGAGIALTYHNVSHNHGRTDGHTVFVDRPPTKSHGGQRLQRSLIHMMYKYQIFLIQY